MKNLKLTLSLFLLCLVFATCKKDMAMPTVTDVDGNVYHTVKIGNQIWLRENLKTNHYQNGDAIENAITASAWLSNVSGAYCDDPNRPDYAKIYGHLYNWQAVSDVRKIAPEGWHIPSQAEWQTLVENLGGKTIAGGKAKETGTAHWKSPNTGATNSSVFTGLPGGQREGVQGLFNYSNTYAGFWSNSTVANNQTWADIAELGSGSTSFNLNNQKKNFGLSVRCIKD